MSRKCLIVDSIHPSIFPMLREAGWEVVYAPEITREEIKLSIEGFAALIIRSKTIVNEDLLAGTTTLKVVARAGAGLDNVDVSYLNSRGIAVIHAAEGNKDAVGEFTVGLLLSLLRNIPRANLEVRERKWNREENRGEEIMHKTIGIIGYGNMGRAFARRLSGFSCKILAYDKYKSRFGDQFVEEVPMERLFEEADIVSLHIPLTAETRGMVNLKYIHSFTRKIVLINTARGEIVNLEDLVTALEQGKVRGAALDVLENERLLSLTDKQRQTLNSLSSYTNVILTPHIAGWTFESHEKINVVLIDKLKTIRS